MQIISHRGYWKTEREKNQEIAFRRSFNLGFGTETDVRDCAQALVISHDMPTGSEMSLGYFASMAAGKKFPLAMNIKADGLAGKLRAAMEKHSIPDWFVFDMSIPDMRSHLKEGNKVFTRMSEVEPDPIYLNECAGVWLDGFDGTWYGKEVVDSLLGRNKRVCIVSSELHKRDHSEQWDFLRSAKFSDEVILCTDMPELAVEHFKY